MLGWLRKLFRPAQVEYRQPDPTGEVVPVAPPNPSVAMPPVAPVNPPVDEPRDERE